MKRICCLLVVMFLIGGCAQEDSLQEAMELRQRLLKSGCTFEAAITADYGDTRQSFRLQCEADEDGDLEFTVMQPESIAGITGSISRSDGKLSFGDKAVAFELLAEGQLSPVSGPWIMVKALRGGYLSSCCREDVRHHLSVDDSYEADSLGLEVWFTEDGCIEYAEIYWQGRMLLSMELENFIYV